MQGSTANGYSSGQAIETAEEIISGMQGAEYAWSGISYQEKISSGQAPALYALTVIIIFLCLAALYESRSIPLAVLLAAPFGVFGTVLAVSLRGLENNIYFQIAC